jgi:hypothetical protein
MNRATKEAGKDAGKKTAAKSATKPAAATASDGAAKAAKPTRASKPKVKAKGDVAAVEANKRLKQIYDLEAGVDKARLAESLAKQNYNDAKAFCKAAESALEQEIREQREGPGPLFN